MYKPDPLPSVLPNRPESKRAEDLAREQFRNGKARHIVLSEGQYRQLVNEASPYSPLSYSAGPTPFTFYGLPVYVAGSEP
jgi:hypothetical protein